MSDAPRGTRLSRRRPHPWPRTRSQASSDAHEGEDGGAGTNADADAHERLAGVLVGALSVSPTPELNAILARRQRDGPPLPDPAQGDDVRDASRVAPMTADEWADAHRDVFGRLPPDVERSELRLAALQREADLLPKSERRALTRAMNRHPLLFVNCPHTRMILEQDEGDFDPAAAARRAARYWDARRRLLGDQACYGRGTFPQPHFADWRCYHRRMLAVLDDPNVGEDLREDAEGFLRAVGDTKIEALNDELAQIEEESVECFNPEEHDDDAAAEEMRNASAWTLAVNSTDELKLQFLRAEDFIEAKAAERLVRYWKMGLRLFGAGFCDRKPVTLLDMEDCSELLRLYQVRLMPEEDDFGRSILVWRRVVSTNVEEQEGCDDKISFERMLQLGINEDQFGKMMWYFIQAALERESCQRNGLVLVADFRTTSRYIARAQFKTRRPYRQVCNDVINCMPAKVRALHFLFGQELPWWLGAMHAVFRLLSGGRRTVIHGGEMEKILAKLGEQNGIKAENLPTDLGGSVDAEYFERWLEDRRVAGL